MKKAGEEEDGKKKTRYRGGWKRRGGEEVAVGPSPLTKGKGGREREYMHACTTSSIILALFPDRR